MPPLDYLSDAELHELEQPLRTLLRDFTYRPDWHFYVKGGYLCVRAAVVDTDDPTQICPLKYKQALPPYAPPSFPWQRWLFDQIMRIERHEAQEFFKIAGMKVYDPHA